MIQTYTDEFLIGLVDFFSWGKWLMLLTIFITFGDLKFGIDASIARKEVIKRSRAIRRTFDKISSYFIWVIVAYTFGKAFGDPLGINLLPLIILLVIYGVELESIYANYFASKGKKLNIDIFKLFSKKIDIIDIEDEDKKK